MKLATWLLAAATFFLAAAPARAQEDKEARNRMILEDLKQRYEKGGYLALERYEALKLLEELFEGDRGRIAKLHGDIMPRSHLCLVIGCPGIKNFTWEEVVAKIGSLQPAPPQDEKEALKKKILEEIEKKLKEETDRILKEIEKLIDDEIAKAKGKKPDAPAPAPAPGKPGFLGVRPMQEQPTPEEFKEMKIEGGVRIEVIEGMPAEKAGLLDEDIILEIDGTKVKEFPEMPRLLQKKTAGSEVKLKVLRGKQTKEFTVKLAERPQEPGEPEPAPEPPKEPPKPEGKPGTLGVKPGDASGKGMTISGVVEGSPAAKAGIKEGDVLTKMDATPIWKEDDLAIFMKKAVAGQEVEVTLLREGKEVKLKVKLAERK